MARKSIIQLQQDLLTSFPDNITGLITPAILRTYFNNFLEAIRPSYGWMTRATPNAQLLNTTFQPVIFEAGFVSDVPDYTYNLAQGHIRRLEAGTCQLMFTASISGTNGIVVRIELFKNEAPTPFGGAATMTGLGEPIEISFIGIQFDGAAVDYEIRARVQTGSANITFQSMEFIAQTLFVNNY